MIYSHRRNSILGTALTLTALAASANVIPPLITTIADEIGSDYKNFGYIIMFQYFSFFLAGITGGWIGEKFNLNSRKLVFIGLLIVASTLFAGSFLESLSQLAMWAIPLGFGGGLVLTFGSIMISNHEKNNSSKLLNRSLAFFCIGAIIAPQLISFFVYVNISWQTIFVIFGLFILSIMFIFMLLTRKEALVESKIKNVQILKIPLFKDRMFYLLAATLLVYVTFENILACWISVYFEKGLKCSVSFSALLISFFWFGLILGRLAISILPSRYSLWPAMLCGSGLMCVMSFGASFSSAPGVVAIFVFAAGVGAGPIWPTTVALCHVARNNQKFTSTVIAIGAIGVIIGSFLGGFIFKFLGFNIFFTLIGFGSLSLLLLSYLSRYYFQKVSITAESCP